MLRFTFALALAAIAGGAAAEPGNGQDWRKSEGVFCAALDRAMAAADKDRGFTALVVGAEGDTGRTSLTFPGMTRCSAYGDSLFCTRAWAPPELTVAAVTADTSRCLGGKVRPKELEGFQVFELPGFTIQIEGECSDDCEAGRTVNYRMFVKP